MDEWPDTPARQAANVIFDRLEALPTPADEAPAWRFDDAAQVSFTEWRTELELRLRSDSFRHAFTFRPNQYPARPPFYSGRFRFKKHYYPVIHDLREKRNDGTPAE